MRKLTMVNSVDGRTRNFLYMSLFRAPWAVKVACTVLTGGVGRRAVR